MKRVLAATCCMSLLAIVVTAAQPRVVEAIQFTGNHRVPDDSLRLWIRTREGDDFSREQVSRDLRTILAQGFFEDAKVFTEEGPRGGLVVIFEVEEYPVILDIDFPGLKTVSESDVLEEWRKRSIGLSKEAQFDPVKANRAAAAIRDLLAGKGRPDATVVAESEEISPTAVALHFRTEEGDRARFAVIEFEGNAAFTDDELRSHMKIVKEAGLISGLTSKDIYDRSRLDYELNRLRLLYYDHGYLNVKIHEPMVEEAGDVTSGVPLVGGKDRGLRVTVPIEEGRVYRVGEVMIDGATVYPVETITAVLGVVPGETLRYGKVRERLEALEVLYGERGYINFTPDVAPDLRDDPADPTRGIADIVVRLEEGRSFTVGRIEFKGNTYTRDKVLRREMVLDEGATFNKRYFDLSVLRLNQLGYFDRIDDTDFDIRTNQKTGIADIDVRVQEKGRQQIQFTGGGLGVGGSFVGLQYSTNNLLGRGESLTFDLQTGDRTKQFSFGFTEPYVLDRPVSAGFQLFYQTSQYVNTAAGDPDETLFTRRSVGGALALSAPLTYLFPRSVAARFARLGLSYSYRTSSIDDPAPTIEADQVGTIASYTQARVVQSTITPSFLYSTVDGGLDPTRGQHLSLGVALSGGPFGGDVRTVQPTLEYRFFAPLRLISKREASPDVFAVRVSAGHIRAFGDALDTNSLSFVGGTPFLSRYFLGGDDTIRGYSAGEIAPLVPVAQYVTQSNVSAENLSGRTLDVVVPAMSSRHTIAPGAIRTFTANDRFAGDALTAVGADSQLLLNVEYRVAIAGPLSVAAFADVGSAFNVRRLADQTASVTQLGLPLSSYLVVNPRGQIATPHEVAGAETPEVPGTSPYPPGFRAVRFVGDREVRTEYLLSTAADGFRENLRSTVGTELRVTVPGVNLPVRFIFGYNPHEGRPVFRFAFGRTF